MSDNNNSGSDYAKFSVKSNSPIKDDGRYIYMNESDFSPLFYFAYHSNKLYFKIEEVTTIGRKELYRGELVGISNGTNYDYRVNFERYIKPKNQIVSTINSLIYVSYCPTYTRDVVYGPLVNYAGTLKLTSGQTNVNSMGTRKYKNSIDNPLLFGTKLIFTVNYSSDFSGDPTVAYLDFVYATKYQYDLDGEYTLKELVKSYTVDGVETEPPIEEFRYIRVPANKKFNYETVISIIDDYSGWTADGDIGNERIGFKLRLNYSKPDKYPFRTTVLQSFFGTVYNRYEREEEYDLLEETDLSTGVDGMVYNRIMGSFYYKLQSLCDVPDSIDIIQIRWFINEDDFFAPPTNVRVLTINLPVEGIKTTRIPTGGYEQFKVKHLYDSATKLFYIRKCGGVGLSLIYSKPKLIQTTSKLSTQIGNTNMINKINSTYQLEINSGYKLKSEELLEIVETPAMYIEGTELVDGFEWSVVYPKMDSLDLSTINKVSDRNIKLTFDMKYSMDRKSTMDIDYLENY